MLWLRNFVAFKGAKMTKDDFIEAFAASKHKMFVQVLRDSNNSLLEVGDIIRVGDFDERQDYFESDTPNRHGWYPIVVLRDVELVRGNRATRHLRATKNGK